MPTAKTKMKAAFGKRGALRAKAKKIRPPVDPAMMDESEMPMMPGGPPTMPPQQAQLAATLARFRTAR